MRASFPIMAHFAVRVERGMGKRGRDSTFRILLLALKGKESEGGGGEHKRNSCGLIGWFYPLLPLLQRQERRLKEGGGDRVSP